MALRPVVTVSCLPWQGSLQLGLESGREVLSEPASWAVAWDKAGWQEDDVKLEIQTTAVERIHNSRGVRYLSFYILKELCQKKP